MEIKALREVITSTADLKPKDITLPKLEECLQSIQSCPFPTEEPSTDILWKVAVQYCAVLTEFAVQGLVEKQNQQTAESDEVINLHDQAQYLTTIDLVRQFTLHLYLPRELRGVSKCEAQLMVKLEEQERVRRLTYCTAQFRRVFETKLLALHPRLPDTVIDFLAASYSLAKTTLMQNNSLPSFPREHMFRSLLVIKGSPGLPLELAKALHNDLLHLTGEPGGFPVLCRILLSGDQTSENAPSWRKGEVIAKIVSSKGHTKMFYRQVLSDCFEFYHWAVQQDTQEAVTYATICIECLKRFMQLPAPYRELHARIDEYFFRNFRELAAPQELVAGCVVQERLGLLSNLLECNMAFTGSTVSSLPSSLLVPYLPICLKLLTMLPPACEEHTYLHNLIVFCLSNRTKQELTTILNSLLLNRTEGDVGKYQLHPKVIYKCSENDTNYSLQIGPATSDQESDTENLLPVLVDVLKASNRNLLLYDVFLTLLNELLTGTWTGRSHEPEPLLDGVERDTLLCNRFHQKYTLIQSLMDLISHKHFHSQLYDNPKEVLTILTASLTKAIDTTECSARQNSDILEVVLSIFQEFLQRIRNRYDVADILKLLLRYRNSASCSDALKVQIDLLCHGPTISEHDGLSESPCLNALSLCSDQQPYCKVYGTTLLLKLLKERDPETVAQRHKILILALVNLRDEESYAFLNSVRLLVALCDVLEAEVVDELVKEYLNESNEIDYRLKIGEATVKTVETLGPFAVRYRDALLNCFLTGTRNAVDEFRTSSLSNVGSVCRILSYQVHHFFYELFTGIKSIVETDNYLPAKRAAILVLSQLLEGIEGLMDFQEYLLLIYRFLKHIIATDKDDVTKLQAAVALDHLKAKTKDFLQINPDELERRMFGRVI